MDAGQMRSLARSARDGRSEDTIAEYERIAERLEGRHWRDYAEECQAGKSYGYLLKAAWRYQQAGHLLEALRRSDRARKAGDKTGAGDWRKRAEALAGVLESEEAPWKGATGKKKGKTSKRASLSRLPEDWRERLIKALKPDDVLPAVVLALTGCRPCEYKKGVTLERDGDDLKVTIHGGKQSAFTQGGQAVRVLVFDGRDALANALIGLADKTGGMAWVQEDLGAWRKRFTRAAAKLGFKGISPYSLRHQFSGDQKQRGWNDDRLSQALGHASARMKQNYGHANQGKSRGGSLKSVTATQQVRNQPGPLPGKEPVQGPSLG